MPESPLSTIHFPNPAPHVDPAADQVSAEAERRRLRRWFWALGVLALVGFFGLLKFNYPVAEAANGRTYKIISQGRYVGSDGSRTELRYFTELESMDRIPEEAQTLLPLISGVAEQFGDRTIRISAVRHLLRYGLFSVDKSVHVDFTKEGNEWRPVS